MRTIDPSWSHYPDTILDITTSVGHHTLDLRAPVTDADRAALAALGLGRPFAVLTACDPHGRPASPDANARATAALRDLLHTREALLAHATGRSPDGAHAEPGFACALPQDAAVAIARDCGQSALFWYDGARVWLVGACVGAPAIPLPRRAA